MSGLQKFFGLFCILAVTVIAVAFWGISPGEHGTYVDDVLIVAAAGVLVQDMPLYATLQETCRRFGCGMSKLYEIIGEGKIEAKKWGKRVLVNQASAREYFDALPPAPIKPSARARRRTEQAAQRS